MTLGQQIVADWKQRYQPHDQLHERVVVREERAFYAIDGERVIYGIARRTEERNNT
ncbi:MULTISPECIES: hypothetical protein [unclassified Bradyrhizobium]|uniref:hypothetical protein n=1 Tax=unclassified Bradyrhizobium TaxID=2631580 RepID=UPI001CD5F88D|nr:MULTISPECIES: hypothetical protein [unclassified Bradyrhizobium]MCA1378893.1 hypothetical protein [Bradyrhizobium sp. IC4060]MCA1476758.1 hypothetical protein [Bradyrhizobium sp. NBAIM08]MCA1488913.1 hypothetical protein [Bradyrhizobium sp. IC4061]